MALAQMNRGQVLVFFALVIPMVLVPVAVYAIDATVLETRAAHLQEVAALAAEQAAQQVDAATLRSGGGLIVDPANARAIVARAVAANEPQALVVSVDVSTTQVTVSLSEQCPLPVNLLSRSSVSLRAQASARLTAGYDSPSSFLPLPSKTF
jgi:hypothetical protein